METVEQITVDEAQDEKIFLPEAYVPWADLLLGAWDESKDYAPELVGAFWETYSPLDATALLFALLMAGRGRLLPYFPGERTMDQYHHDLTVALAAFYQLTVPVSEQVELVKDYGEPGQQHKATTKRIPSGGVPCDNWPVEIRK